MREAGPAAQAGHPDRQAGLVDEDEALRIEIGPLLDQPDDEGLMRIEARAASPALRPRRRLTQPGRAIHRIAVEIPTPNLATACRADSPSVEAV